MLTISRITILLLRGRAESSSSKAHGGNGVKTAGGLPSSKDAKGVRNEFRDGK
jgi:hypothetical protein